MLLRIHVCVCIKTNKLIITNVLEKSNPHFNLITPNHQSSGQVNRNQHGSISQKLPNCCN